jgi:hypothetical protein
MKLVYNPISETWRFRSSEQMHLLLKLHFKYILKCQNIQQNILGVHPNIFCFSPKFFFGENAFLVAYVKRITKKCHVNSNLYHKKLSFFHMPQKLPFSREAW